MEENKIAIFEGKQIRKVIFQDEWWFSVTDIVQILTDSIDARDYWFKMKIRVKSDDGIELSTICRQLKLIAQDGKLRETDCASTEGIRRIVQSIPSPKVEPLKRWLAKVGYERIQEIENPELAQERMKNLYEQKGYSQNWIDKRLRGMAIRQNLTDEWKERGIHAESDFAIPTGEISKAIFGMTPTEYKKLKKLKRENLRDHMTDLELIFSMLGERVTTEISSNEKPETFAKSKQVAVRGGNVAGAARKHTEKELGHTIITGTNYLKNPESQKNYEAFALY